MTDATLRELERRFRASGSVEDEATWLRERLRAGDLSQERLELAAYLGAPAARETLGEAPPKHTKAPKTGVLGFVRKGLAHWGRLPLLRAAIAATQMVTRDESHFPEKVGWASVHLAEEYAVEPRPEILDRYQARSRAPLTEIEEGWQEHWWIAKCCGETLHNQVDHYGNNYCSWRAKDTVERVVGVIGSEAEVRRAIVAELIPWALGYSDPVRERVEARRREAGE